MYGIDIELGDYRIGSETISSGDDGYYEGCACDKDASTNAYSYDKCRVVRGTWRPSELVLYVGDEHVACRDVASGMHHGHLPGKVYFIEAEAGRDATAEGGVYTTVVEALSLVQEEEGTGMYLINAPEKAVVRFFKIEKKAAEEPQTVDPSVVESATGSGVDTQEEQEIDHEAPAIGVEKTDADVAQKEVISGQQEQEIAEVLEKTEAPVEVKEETEVLLKEDTLVDLEKPVVQLPEEAEEPQEESATEVSAPAQPESEGDLKSEVSVEANAGMQQEVADVPTALPLKDPDDEDVLNYLLARK
ncbi:hypothetical protein ANAPRD1_01167 [Anaplasma phagocytophilum]|uniref:hypothetical protein n=1 Tax=Anaplasma phagocytophilum TaxID=948 RepID=UPI0007E03337|nr:hypothetical protein [Anaplasma phagocytophilum]SCV66613.1 hypothetical protein ANAPRD1_01167 [Anaplasma phagocytophilum]